MNESEITALMRGAAPAIEGLLARTISPLVDRIAKLERDLAAARRMDGVRSAVSSAVDALLPMEVRDVVNGALPAMVASAVREAVSTLPEPAPRKDADPEVVRQLIADAVAALTPAEPGKDVDLELMRQAIAEEVARIPAPEPGKDADPDEVERLVVETVERTLAGWEKPRDGASVTLEDVAPVIERAVSEAVAALPPPEPGKPGAPGKLEMVRAWHDAVWYEADVVTFDGAMYQALRDTGRAPPHEDWLCIVERGGAGADAANIEITGTFDVTRTYRKLNVVALNGGSFIAKQDDPGPCPGDGWQLVASQGGRGKPGESVKGDPGRPGPAVRSAEIDDEGMLTLTNADGTTVQCDLYPLLAKVAST